MSVRMPEQAGYERTKRALMGVDVVSVVYVGGNQAFVVFYNDDELAWAHDEKEAMCKARLQAHVRRPSRHRLRLLLTRDKRKGVDGRYDDTLPPPF